MHSPAQTGEGGVGGLAGLHRMHSPAHGARVDVHGGRRGLIIMYDPITLNPVAPQLHYLDPVTKL